MMQMPPAAASSQARLDADPRSAHAAREDVTADPAANRSSRAVWRNAHQPLRPVPA
jgi:hypothetical protein